MKTELKSDKNIILITIDCLRADHLHCMGYPKKITPTIDALAKDGVLFTNAVANAPYTSLSIPSFISSTIPPARRFKETIASVLKKNGYATVAFIPNPIIISSLTKGESITRGFDKFDLMLSKKKRYNLIIGAVRLWGMKSIRQNIKEDNIFYKKIYPIYDKLIQLFPNYLCPKEHNVIPSAEDINEKAIDWVEKQKGKFFLWIHYMDVHEPYAPPNYENQKEMLYLITKYRDFPNKLTGKEIEKLMNLYDLSINYTDSAINDFLEKIKKLNKYENSIIIISSDHGDAFAEHDGILGHGGKFEALFFEEVIHVPLIIHGIDKKGVVINKAVQLLDLAPTICELVGILIPVSFFGNSLFLKTKTGIIINSSDNIGYKTQDYKLMINKSHSKRKQLYNLKNDPDERINIYYDEKELREKLELEMTNTLMNYKRKKELIEDLAKLLKHKKFIKCKIWTRKI